MAKSTAWRDFELLLTAIHKNLAPGAEVKHNQKLLGRISKRQRQVDILIIQKVGYQTAQIAVECRDYKRPVGIDKIDAFISKLDDVGVGYGVMVSRSGFDAGAKALAAHHHRITLLSYRAATDADWQAWTASQSWVQLITSGRQKLTLKAKLRGEPVGALLSDDLLVGSSGASATADEIANKLINAAVVGPRPADYEAELDCSSGLTLRRRDREFVVDELKVLFRVHAYEYVLNVKLSGGHVLTDAGSGHPKATEMYTVAWNMPEVLASKPDRELTAEQFDEIQSSGGARMEFDPRTIKPFVRLKVTAK